MGQQQILLIVLAAVIVGIAVVVGMQMMGESAVDANKRACTQDLLNLATKAQSWFRTPTSLGGGGRSFLALTADAAGLAVLTPNATTQNGTLAVKTAGTATAVVLQITGIEDADSDGGMMVLSLSVEQDAVGTLTVDEP
ncbi:MAG: hypothetical protein V1800_11925 [Candidatus Latescibacterota bacterium]